MDEGIGSPSYTDIFEKYTASGVTVKEECCYCDISLFSVQVHILTL